MLMCETSYKYSWDGHWALKKMADMREEDVFSWAEYHGCECRVREAMFGGVRGLQAVCDLKEEDVALTVPEALIIEIRTVQSSSLVRHWACHGSCSSRLIACHFWSLLFGFDLTLLSLFVVGIVHLPVCVLVLCVCYCVFLNRVGLCGFGFFFSSALTSSSLTVQLGFFSFTVAIILDQGVPENQVSECLCRHLGAWGAVKSMEDSAYAQCLCADFDVIDI